MVLARVPTIQSSDGPIIRRSAAISSCVENKKRRHSDAMLLQMCYVLATVFGPMLVDAIAERLTCGSPTRARTWDLLRINSPSGASVISLFHQLLTASAQPRHRSRTQCNAGACKTTLAHFWTHLAPALHCSMAFIDWVRRSPVTAFAGPSVPHTGIELSGSRDA